MDIKRNLAPMGPDGQKGGDLFLVTVDNQQCYALSMIWPERNGETDIGLVLLEGPHAGDTVRFEGDEYIYQGPAVITMSKKSSDWHRNPVPGVPLSICISGQKSYFVVKVARQDWAVDIEKGHLVQLPRSSRFVGVWDIRADSDEEPFITSMPPSLMNNR